MKKSLLVAAALAMLASSAYAGPEVGSGRSAVGSPDPSKNSRGHGTSSKDGQTYKHWGPGGGGIGTGGKKQGNDRGAPGGD